jgi:hypothetical protein
MSRTLGVETVTLAPSDDIDTTLLPSRTKSASDPCQATRATMKIDTLQVLGAGVETSMLMMAATMALRDDTRALPVLRTSTGPKRIPTSSTIGSHHEATIIRNQVTVTITPLGSIIDPDPTLTYLLHYLIGAHLQLLLLVFTLLTEIIT